MRLMSLINTPVQLNEEGIIKRLVLNAQAKDKNKQYDPFSPKGVSIAMRHDHTFPTTMIGRIGHKATPLQYAEIYSKALDHAMREQGITTNTDVAADWLTRLYVNNVADWGDITEHGIPSIAKWARLAGMKKTQRVAVMNPDGTQRREFDPNTQRQTGPYIYNNRNVLDDDGNPIPVLKPEHRVLKDFKNINKLEKVMQSQEYEAALATKNADEIYQQDIAGAEDIVILNNAKVRAMVPLNYAACTMADREPGTRKANFCTGYDQGRGRGHFGTYSRQGVLVNIHVKDKINTDMGKWQMHAATGQLANNDQEYRGNTRKQDELFARENPGLLKKICDALAKHAEEIKTKTEHLTPSGQGYNIEKEIALIKTTFPISYASESSEKDQELQGEIANPGDDTPGTWKVTHNPSNRSANIHGENLQAVKDSILARHPNTNFDDFTFEKLPEEPQAAAEEPEEN
jgi:hypothetical protein